MREKFTLSLDPSTQPFLSQPGANAITLLTQFFGEPNSANYRAMCEGLVAYHNKEGGSPEVKEFGISDAAYHPETRTGWCKCRFGIHFHYTCSDVHHDAKDTIRWDFEVDAENGTIKFTGEEPWVRDAD